MHLTIIDETFLPPSSFWQTKAFLYLKIDDNESVQRTFQNSLWKFQMDKFVKFVPLVCLNDRMK